MAIHLDKAHKRYDIYMVVKSLLQIPHDTEKSALLFSSPQAIVNKECWSDMIQKLIDKGLLCFVCIDESHLFVHYRLSFSRIFAAMQKYLFQHLTIDSECFLSKIPILFMSATCTLHSALKLKRYIRFRARVRLGL